MEDYYEMLEFDENPFSTNPNRFTDKLVNMEDILNEVYYRIKSGNMLVIKGPKGTGKTSILMNVTQRFGGYGKVIYVNSEKIGKDLNITKLLKNRYGIMGRIFNKTPKNMTLLLDNVHKLSKKNNERIKYYFDQNYLRSVIFTCLRYSRVKFSPSLKDRIGRRIVSTPELDEENAIKLIRNRIFDSDLLTDELIVEIFRRSKKNPKLLLENCDKLAREVLKNNSYRVKFVDIKRILGEKND
jgi:Cdc6-like AAA superfamily ATPase